MTSLLSASADVLGAQRPRLLHLPEYASSAGVEAVDLARYAGLPLDPWEEFVLVGGCGERPDGKWSAYEVGVNAPRQNGKGAILEARELAGLFLFGEQLLIHSAHEQATSSEHFRRLLNLIEGVPEFEARLRKVVRGKGSEAIELTNGQRILFKTRTGGGGRGLTGDLVVLDEAMVLPEAMTAALVPTMAARSMHGNPQLWYAGSAVDQINDEHGVVFSRVRQRGLAGGERVAWFEWSIEGDDPAQVSEDVRTDPESWAQANPGLGIRISQEHIANECAGALGAREFAVERLGVGDWPSGDDAGDEFAEQWTELLDADSQMLDPVCLAIDARPDRSAAAIGAAGWRADGLSHVEPVDHRPGTGWVAERLLELVEKHPAMAVRCASRGPAASLIPELEQLGIAIEPVNESEFAQGCGRMYDAIDQKVLRHTGRPDLAAALAAAIRGARRRNLSEAWAWSRKSSSVDISPLVACTLALWGSVEAGQGGGGFEW
jgi:hypothetical protein